jgi:tRNA modification GTPase
MRADYQDTICAISTAPGMGAIAVIRVSGRDAFARCRSLFSKDLNEAEGYTLHLGRWGTADRPIDQVMVAVFRAPHSFTGEDVWEISCHGSTYIQQEILHSLCDAGCRLAGPGEFSLRAFLNGKVDLAQAEAIADLISSSGSAAHRNAYRQMRGGFSRKLKAMRLELIDYASLIELELDFSEEDVEFASREKLLALTSDILSVTHHMEASFRAGNIMKSGIPVAIAGRPNAGKSTLLNQLLNEERAIVSDIPGTTRDTVEDVVQIEGYSFRFIDTAGLRKTEDSVEKIGIQRTREKMETAGMVLVLLSAAEDHDTETAIEEILGALDVSDKKVLVVMNKSDLHPTLELPQTTAAGYPLICISAKTGAGIDTLKQQLWRQVDADTQHSADVVVTNARHYEALHACGQSLERAREGLKTGLSGELVAFDIRDALHHLGLITGEVTTDDLLGNIFSRFCIGK